MDHIECVVIGAGVIGLAVARALALAGHDVLVLEREGAIGTGTSSRNSEVIHAGIYYPQGSLKAQLCVAGRHALYAYAAERGIGHRRCGKLIVATQPSQEAELQTILDRARANGVDDLELLTRAQAQALEPGLQCVAAIHSPSTGIIDSHALMLAMQGDLENAGGVIAFKSPVARARPHADGVEVETADGAALRCNYLINAAGLQAPDVARTFEGLEDAAPTAYYAKGNYFVLAGRAPFSRLIYPVPEPGGLGVHLTLDLGGQAKFGPDVQWVASADELQVDPARGDAFYAEVRKYWPGLPDGALSQGYAGIRPKISGPGKPASDFVIRGHEGFGGGSLINLFGIESPGLTSSLAMGEFVGQYVSKLLR